MPRALGWVVAAALLLFAGPAAAATRRIVVAVGHNTGADGRAPLRYAEEDAGKFADVMVDLGEVAPGDVFLVQGKGSSTVHAALDQATAAVAKARTSPDDRVVLLFFYSGHSDGQTIELGRERLSYAELKRWLASTGADVRIAIVDSCRSGQMVAQKGGVRGPAFNVTMIDDLVASGEAFLTSAAADEDALESSEVRGSFFTHHLVSGLRGAADASGDGVVTLSEAYDYAFNHTVMSTAQAGAPPQHPTYDYRVAGRGELRLTEVTRRSAILEMPEDFQRALIVQPRRDQVIAEVGGGMRRVAVAPGEYGVRIWRAGRSSAGRVRVGAGQVLSITWDQLTATDPPVVVAPKGGRTEEPTLVEPALMPAQQAEWNRLALYADPYGTIYSADHRQMIDQRAALDRMGQTELLQRYDDELALERLMIWGGLGIGAAMLLIDRVEASDCASEIAKSGAGGNFEVPGCVGDVQVLDAITTLAVIGGITLAVVGVVRHPEPVRGPQVRFYVDDYNKKLRARLTDPTAAPAAPKPAAPKLRVSGWLHAGDRASGGLSLSGRF